MAVLNVGDTLEGWRTIPSWHALLAEVTSTGSRTAQNTLLVIDTRHARVLAHLAGMPMPSAIDEANGWAIVVVRNSSTSPPTGWAINLRTGHAAQVRGRFSAITMSFGVPRSPQLSYADVRRGFALSVNQSSVIHNTQTAISLTVQMIPFSGASTRSVNIPVPDGATANPLPRTFADTLHNRLLVPIGVRSSSALGAVTITALVADTLHTAWKREIPYLPAATSFDPAAGRLLLVAPGGRVTVLDTTDGNIEGMAHSAPLSPAVVPAATMGTIVVDWRRNRAFIPTPSSAGRRIDVADWRAGSRRQLVTYAPMADYGTLNGVVKRPQQEVNQTLIGQDAIDGRPVIFANVLANGSLLYNVLHALDPARGASTKVGKLPVSAKPLPVDSNYSILPSDDRLNLEMQPDSAFLDGHLFATAQVQRADDISGPQTLPALVSIPF